MNRRSADNLRLGDTVATDMDAMNCVPQGSVPNSKGRVPIGFATGGRQREGGCPQPPSLSPAAVIRRACPHEFARGVSPTAQGVSPRIAIARIVNIARNHPRRNRADYRYSEPARPPLSQIWQYSHWRKEGRFGKIPASLNGKSRVRRNGRGRGRQSPGRARCPHRAAAGGSQLVATAIGVAKGL